MLKDKQHTRKLSAVERDIDAAIQRVHDAYGTDLSAFFQKVQRETQRTQLEQESSVSQKRLLRPLTVTKKRLK